MQTYPCKTRPVLRPRAVPGKHAKSSLRTDSPGRTARRILFTAFLLGSLAAGSAATFEHGSAPGSVTAHAVVPPIMNPWMY